jgi:hypothetical protein
MPGRKVGMQMSSRMFGHILKKKILVVGVLVPCNLKPLNSSTPPGSTSPEITLETVQDGRSDDGGPVRACERLSNARAS